MSDLTDYAILKKFKDQESGLGGHPPGVLRHGALEGVPQEKLDDLCDSKILKAVDWDWDEPETPKPKPTPWNAQTLDELTKNQIQDLVSSINPSTYLSGDKPEYIKQALRVLAEG